MSAVFTIYLLIIVWVSFLILLIGVIIYRGNVELIAGYDPDKVADKDGLAKWVGTHIILSGIYLLLLPVLDFVVRIPVIGLWFFGFAIIIARTIIGSKKFEKKIQTSSNEHK